MNVFEILRWWWETNAEWIKIHDPWVIPIIAVSIPLSLVIRAIAAFVRMWRRK